MRIFLGSNGNFISFMAQRPFSWSTRRRSRFLPGDHIGLRRRAACTCFCTPRSFASSPCEYTQETMGISQVSWQQPPFSCCARRRSRFLPGDRIGSRWPAACTCLCTPPSFASSSCEYTQQTMGTSKHHRNSITVMPAGQYVKRIISQLEL